MSIKAAFCALLVLAAILPPAQGESRSVEDLVGAFSIEKTIKLGDSGCYNSNTLDPLADPMISSGAAPLSMEDGMPPSLASLDFSPGAVNVTYPQAVYFIVHVIDDESGLSWTNASSIRFISPSGRESAEASILPTNMTGSVKDGLYGTTMVIPRGSEKGAWRIDRLTLADRAGNSKVMAGDEIEALGMPVQILVN